MKQADAEVAKGNLDKAADTLERALRIEADNPDLWMKLSQINAQQGNHEQAAQYGEQGQSLSGATQLALSPLLSLNSTCLTCWARLGRSRN